MQAVLLLLPLCILPSREAAKRDGRVADKVCKHLCYLSCQFACGTHHQRPHPMPAQLLHPTRASSKEVTAVRSHVQAEKAQRAL